jgi:hypothetical protein
VDIPRHVAKRWPIPGRGRDLLVNHLKSSNFKILKVVGDGEDKRKCVKNDKSSGENYKIYNKFKNASCS